MHEQSPRWHDRKPRFVHSVKWVDSDGLEHLHIIRADALDEVLHEVRTLKLYIRRCREPAQETPATPPANASPDGWCSIHNVAMQQHRNGTGTWWSHRLPSGDWCKGK